LELARLVTENFRYVEAVAALRGGRPEVVRSKTCTAKLLFDAPVRASDLAARAESMKVGGPRLRVASEPDLLRLKRIALAARPVPGDAQDVAFLEARRPR
jgi:hypothetical protein